MIIHKTGDLLEAKTQAIVNAVNCVGVMGKGIALSFKHKYPENFKLYKTACDAGEVQIGKMFVTKTGEDSPEYIVNFPTKQHWKYKSQIEWVSQGLVDLRCWIYDNKIASIALPLLGTGAGGLPEDDIQFLIKIILEDLETEIHVYHYK